MKNYTLCEFECPKCDKCARYLPDLDKSNVTHFAWNPYKYDIDKCPFFEPYEDVEMDEDVVNNILDRIKLMQDAKDDH